MSKVFIHATMSLDGFIAEPHDEVGWSFQYGTDGMVEEVVPEIGAVNLAKDAAGDKSVALLGASVDQQCLKAGLVDEILIHMVPVVLGDDIRLFDHLDNRPIRLERTSIVSTAQITSLRFRVVQAGQSARSHKVVDNPPDLSFALETLDERSRIGIHWQRRHSTSRRGMGGGLRTRPGSRRIQRVRPGI
jgi:hypothetical protein